MLPHVSHRKRWTGVEWAATTGQLPQPHHTYPGIRVSLRRRAMPLTLQDYLRRGGPSLLPSYLLTGAACLGTLVYLRSISSSLSTREPEITPSPKETALPWLTLQETENLPYPPDPLPGRRDVGSPLGEYSHLQEQSVVLVVTVKV